MNKEKLIVEKVKENKILFSYVTLFRKSIFLSFIESNSLVQAHNKWIEKRVDYLNKTSPNFLYQKNEFETDDEDKGVLLNDSTNLFCFSNTIREFYLHTIAPLQLKSTTLYSLFFTVGEGILTSQTKANSVEEAYQNFLKNKNQFDEYLENPELYYFLIEKFEDYQATIKNHSYIKVASMNDKKEFVKPRKRRKNEWRFSQKNYTLFIFPTFEGECENFL